VKPTSYVLTGGRIVLPRDVLEGGAVLVEGGRIKAVLEPGDPLPERLPRRDLGRAWLTPGLVELHIHGCGGVAFDGLDRVAAASPARVASGAGAAGAAELLRARDFLRARGVTTFVPTLVCRDGPLGALALAMAEAGLDERELPGIYLEGPFVNRARRGGIPEDAICDPDPREFRRIVNLARGRLRLMTVAPELRGCGEIVERIEAVGAVPCLGHSDCDLDRVELPRGKYSITHLFNAMSPFSHKEAGLAMLPFLDRRPFAELNADGIHVNEQALRVCAAALEPDKLALISDAAPPAGLPPGTYPGPHGAMRSGPDGVRWADSGTLMGSPMLAPEVLRNWLRVTGASVPNAVRMLSLTPATILGIEDRRGAIAPGQDAVMVLWNGELESVAEVFG